MKGLESGKDKIQKICDVLRHETLEPAKQEAKEIVENARLQAQEIMKDAQAKADSLITNAKIEIEEKKKVFEATLQLTCRQTIELLKQKIEEKLFNQNLSDLILKETADPKLISHIIDSFMKGMQERGLEEEFVAVIPKNVSARMINSMIATNVLQSLQKQSVVLGDFAGGVQIQMKGRNITVDISDAALRDVLARFIRQDFRQMLFNC